MPPLERRPLAAAMALLFSSISPVAAQSVPDATAQQAHEPSLPEVKVESAPEAPNFRTDTTRSGTRTETPLRDVPQFINIVPQPLIRSQNATTLQDALRNIPGILYRRPKAARNPTKSFICAASRSTRTSSSTASAISANTTATSSPPNRSKCSRDRRRSCSAAARPAGSINQTSKVANRLDLREIAVTLGSFDQKRATFDLNLKSTGTRAPSVSSAWERSPEATAFPRTWRKSASLQATG